MMINVHGGNASALWMNLLCNLSGPTYRSVEVATMITLKLRSRRVVLTVWTGQDGSFSSPPAERSEFQYVSLHTSQLKLSSQQDALSQVRLCRLLI